MNWTPIYIAIGLVLIMAVTVLVLTLRDRRREKESAAMPSHTPDVENEPIAAQDDGELIAVLTAAVAAMMGEEPGTPKIRVSAFRRIGSDAPVWNTAARRQNVM